MDARAVAYAQGFAMGERHAAGDVRRRGLAPDCGDARCGPLEAEKDAAAEVLPFVAQGWFFEGYDAGYETCLGEGR